MAKRPKLSEDSFLKHLFAPSKNPLPSGIRKRKLVGTKGRTKRRLAAYNRMSGANQELLQRAGLRDEYLAGNATLSDARRTLRTTAVEKGIAHPLRQPVTGGPSRSLDDLVAGYVYRSMTGDLRPTVNYDHIRSNITHLPPNVKPNVLKWSPGKIKAYASNDENKVWNGNTHINPLWYH